MTSVNRCLHVNADSFDTDDVFFIEALWFVLQIVLTSLWLHADKESMCRSTEEVCIG